MGLLMRVAISKRMLEYSPRLLRTYSLLLFVGRSFSIRGNRLFS
jgi:hypothetical protein